MTQHSSRELRLVVLLSLLGSLALLWAAGRTWATVPEQHRLTIEAVGTAVRGRELVPALAALGWVGLAGVVALAATRRWGRVAVGVLVLGAGVVAAVLAVRRLDVSGMRLDAVEAAQHCQGPCFIGSNELHTVPVHLVWVWVSIVGGILLAVSGLLVALHGRGWGGLSSSYEAPGGKPEAPVTEKAVWDALDRGDDPTA